MAWTKNNNKNVRFNPNRKDDRLLLAEVTARRQHKPRKEAQKEEELILTDPEHVLGMPPDTRVDWLKMALMQSAMGKLKAASLYDVIARPSFARTSGSARKALKASVLANLHLFNAKQKRVIEELWNTDDHDTHGASGCETRSRLLASGLGGGCTPGVSIHEVRVDGGREDFGSGGVSRGMASGGSPEHSTSNEDDTSRKTAGGRRHHFSASGDDDALPVEGGMTSTRRSGHSSSSGSRNARRRRRRCRSRSPRTDNTGEELARRWEACRRERAPSQRRGGSRT
mmetsp:Transcript_35010/g.81223  ORF Transcript_35010/g.81223 Transcript_35010/m.81223 type:complete len:284 (-) Transcript_35010:186-1037(-)